MVLSQVSNLYFCNIANIAHNSDGHGLVFLSRILTIRLYSDCNGFVVVAKVRDQTDRRYVMWDRIMECINICSR